MENNTMENDKVSIKKIAQFFRPLWPAVFITFGILVISQLVMLAQPWVSGKLIDGLIAKDYQATKIFVIGFFTTLVLGRLIQYRRDLFELDNLDFKIRDYVNRKSLEHILSLSLGQHHSDNSSYRSSVANKGREAASRVLSMCAFQLAPSIILLAVSLIYLLLVNLLIGAIAIITTAVFLLVTYLINKKCQLGFDEFEEQYHQMSKHTGEIIRFADLFTLNAVTSKAISQQYDFMERVTTLGRRVWRRHINHFSLASIVRILGQTLIVITGGYLVFNDLITVGKFTSIIMISGTIIGQIGQLEWVQRELISNMASVRSFFKFMAIKPVVNQVANPKPFVMGKIEFSNVGFHYPKREKNLKLTDDPGLILEEDRALQNISFSIQTGQRVAFVGKSGSGKTTIMLLLLRGYDPDTGEITLAKTDLRELDLSDYLREVGYVEQSVNLLDGTVRDNLTLGLPLNHGLTDAQLWSYLNKAQLGDLHSKLEHGLDTIIGEKGIKLSGGERQRLGIARALIKEPKILIFDEATSSLDAESEFQIKQAIEEAGEGRTSIIIAHRLSTVLSCDVIFMIQDGQILGQGTHQELMLSCPEYQALVQRQIEAAKEMTITF